MTWRIFGSLLTGLVLLALLSVFTILRYGDAKYEAGKLACQTENAIKAADDILEASEVRGGVDRKVNAYADPDIDFQLNTLGWMCTTGCK